MVFDVDHWQEVFQTLRRNRLRTILTACGVFWGVCMLVIMLGFGSGFERAVTGDFASFAPNTVMFSGERTSKPFAGHQPGREIQLTLDDGEYVQEHVEGVKLVLPRSGRGGRPRTITHKSKSEVIPVSGELPDYLQVDYLEISKGRFINPTDIAEKRKVAVIGVRVQELLFDKGEDPIGQEIQIDNYRFTVVGVYRFPGAGGRADWFNGRALLPRTTVASLFMVGNRTSSLAVLVKPEYSAAEVEKDIRALLSVRHHVDPTDPRAFESFNREKEVKKISSLFLGISTLTWIVGVLTLLAGAIGVSNIMMIAVAERTKEIGIRKAIGATPASIMVQIVTEAVVLTAMAGYLGLVAGVGILEIAGHIVDSMPKGKGPSFFSRPEIELGKAIIAAAILTVAGALAGLAPARSAVSVRPVEALAHE